MTIPPQADFDAERVRAAAKRSKDGPQARRLLATYPGSSIMTCRSTCGRQLDRIQQSVPPNFAASH